MGRHSSPSRPLSLSSQESLKCVWQTYFPWSLVYSLVLQVPGVQPSAISSATSSVVQLDLPPLPALLAISCLAIFLIPCGPHFYPLLEGRGNGNQQVGEAGSTTSSSHSFPARTAPSSSVSLRMLWELYPILS